MQICTLFPKMRQFFSVILGYNFGGGIRILFAILDTIGIVRLHTDTRKVSAATGQGKRCSTGW